MTVHVCACVVHVCAAGDAWGVPSGCLGGACQGIVRHKMEKCVKNTLIDQNT